MRVVRPRQKSSVLTPRQTEILGFINQYHKRTGLFPAYREIGRAFGIQVSAANRHVKAIEGKGYINAWGYQKGGEP